MCPHLTISEAMVTTFQRTEPEVVVLKKERQKHPGAALWVGRDGRGKPDLKYEQSATEKGEGPWRNWLVLNPRSIIRIT